MVFKKSKEDYFLVSKQLGSLLEVILIYVNNKIITRNDDLEAIETVKDYLHKKFKLNLTISNILWTLKLYILRMRFT